jgi:rhamnose utilization protein RhaD (predicted bifunctional aldolase and dehydrogenase)/NAD(P)-dependent dehydrogenase (short-subunit alcohol dehydrogenase family)
MHSLYQSSESAACRERYGEAHGEDLAERVYTSQLLGRERSLVLHGGGNTSVKGQAVELSGEPVEVLYVKGSGWDLATIEPEGFPACRLGPLLRTCQMDDLSDENMVAALRSQMLDPSSPTPSVEALLHAYLPGKYVDHTHSDAVLTLLDQPDGEQRAYDVWGDKLIYVPYIMPGFLLCKQIVQQNPDFSSGHVMILGQHGIFTWGKSGQESYERMIDAVSLAEAYVEKRIATCVIPTPPDTGIPGDADRRAHQSRLGPILRGALQNAPGGQRFMLHWRDEPEILSLLGRDDAESLTGIGTVTPDHVIRTKPRCAWMGDLDLSLTDEALRAHIEEILASYAEWYQSYFDEHAKTRPDLQRLDCAPRILAIPGLGIAALGKTLKDARVAGDVYSHTAAVLQNAAELGTFCPIRLKDLFEMEYWSLEQAKLKSGGGAAGIMARRIGMVTGAASGIGLATATRLLEEGGHVCLSDRDADALDSVVSELQQRFTSQVIGIRADVTRDVDVSALIDETIRHFGGLDLVVSNAGSAPGGLLHTAEGNDALLASIELNLLSHQRVAATAARAMIRQGTGGCLLFNASKSAFNQGPDFGPYAIPKAGVIALMKQYAVDLGGHGIRSNAINADRIRTGLFDDALIAARAKARGTTPDAYFSLNLLGRETSASDVAAAFTFLTGAEATTGCVLTVDGGNAAAFPR